MLEEIYYVDKRISVIMPVYNDTKYIREAICSVSCQTYQFWELIVVDDGSQQDIKMVLTPLLQDHRIHLIRLERNRGVANARNAGIQQATGRYVAFLDSDDVWLPDKLERQLQFMRKTKAAMSYTSYRRFCHDIQDAGKPVPIVLDVTYDKLHRMFDGDDRSITMRIAEYAYGSPRGLCCLAELGKDRSQDLWHDR